jgi:hypothetical protein
MRAVEPVPQLIETATCEDGPLEGATRATARS